MPLERYYSGDKAFNEFAKIQDADLDAELANWEHKERLFELCGNDRLLARAVFYVSCGRALEYMNSKIPALDGLSPRECVKTPNGLKRLKECILRSP